MASNMAWQTFNLLTTRADDADADEPDASQAEISTSWALFILIMLLILALFASYILQTRRIQAVHETVMSIFAGMVVGLILRLAASHAILSNVSFDYQMFFNLLLPPIILASGYELHQGNFFRNIGSILTFAFAGTFISALVLGLILFIWTRMNLDGVSINFVEAMSVGATLSATDPVTILAIFNTYKVDPKLYTVIFGESILNDAIAIVLFETAQKYKEGNADKRLTPLALFESIGVFIFVFFGSLAIGLLIGMLTSLLLKFTYIRRFPKTESCIIILIAYASYFFSNAIHMSGIVSLLFSGICMKHYAYHNMSRRTQLTTKFIFQVMAQLSENFIFIYLGLSLFTETTLIFKPLFILITVVGICVARWAAVFPLSRAINAVIRYRARRRGNTQAEEIPYSHQAMLFWAGLRGAVGVALAAGLTGPNGPVLRATVLVVVVLTVIIFGGTTARMLEILNIRTGVIEEIDSDDEFDIEYIHGNGANGTYTRKSGTGLGHNPRPSVAGNGYALGTLDYEQDAERDRNGTYSSGNRSPNKGPHAPARRNSQRSSSRNQDVAEQGLLSPADTASLDDDDLDLPPAARRQTFATRNAAEASHGAEPYPTSGARETPVGAAGIAAGVLSRVRHAPGAVSQLISEISEDPADAFRLIDENFIKPRLLLDPGNTPSPSHHGNAHPHGQPGHSGS
ncbi:sodium/hydrogen exchanger 3 [Verruconis gallopava]|uniref:Sodium/hydrogen exchanger n=1 Tax=Verruconis gallopava TaxID=253628 RepID=A0A0D2A224_9PEZI|nr:sodium/hydrogen exchanger 3 [Verruconis gallopava]KIW00813.1 sodium/hydrogen exchanger 3 [Verruconis gallopava]